MRSQLHRLLVMSGFAAAALIATTSSSFAQVVRDHRHGPPPAAPPAPPPQAEAAPREAPPPSKAERHEARREGFVWIPGRWDWRRHEHRWDWVDGHWERERRGHKWREARWERRGDEWVLIDGDWVQVDVRPTAAPPPPREERFDNRAGFVWVRGRWDWRDGNWAWVDGHYERERHGKRWREARWELRDGGYVLVDGDWIDDAPPPPQHTAYSHALADLRTARRYLHRPENVVVRWDEKVALQEINNAIRQLKQAAYEEGDDGDDRPPVDRPTWGGRLDRALELVLEAQREAMQEPLSRDPLTQRLQKEILQHIGNAKRYIVKGIEEAKQLREPPPPPPYNPPPTYNPPPPPPGPTSAPPPPRDENYDRRDGYIWARGHYQWNNGSYEWVPGHWERQRAKLTWYDGRWEQRGNLWVYIEGGWR